MANHHDDEKVRKTRKQPSLQIATLADVSRKGRQSMEVERAISVATSGCKSNLQKENEFDSLKEERVQRESSKR